MSATRTLTTTRNDPAMVRFPHAKIQHCYPVGQYEAECYQFKIAPRISDYANNSLYLVSGGGYAFPGKLTLKPYQVFPVDAPMEWNGNRRVKIAAPTRMAKSMIAECACYWYMEYKRGNGIICYAEKDTVTTAFRKKIAPMIKGDGININHGLRKLWGGKEDDLTQDNIFLRNGFWRTASSQDINDLASFGAGFVYGSEVAKWQKMKDNAVEKLYGRQRDYPIELRYSIIESSPYLVGDLFYQECYKDGTIVVMPWYPCPHCGEYQTLSDSQIRLRQEGVEHPDRQVARLIAEKERAVYYECKHCKQEITEADRIIMDSRVVYAAPAQIDITVKKKRDQAGETVDRSGNIAGPDRNQYSEILITMNRGTDISYPWYMWLADMFNSCHDQAKYQVYENETNARFFEVSTERTVEVSGLESKRATGENGKPAYWMSSTGGRANTVPDQVLSVTAALDSQKDGFYYAICGWGEHREMYVLRYGRIWCPITDPYYMQPEILLQTVSEKLITDNPLRRADGYEYQISGALIDRGGIRETASTDFLCRNIPCLKAYIGATHDDPRREMIWQGDGPWLMGKTERYSATIETVLGTDMFWLPGDCGLDFMKAVLLQWHGPKLDKDGKALRDAMGNEKIIWYHGGEDHYRDCLNMNWAAGDVLGHDRILRDRDMVARLRTAVQYQEPDKAADGDGRQEDRRGNYRQSNNYFSRALGGRR